MKFSSVILLVTFLLLVTGMFASNILLKKEYDKIDKSDLYWTYGKILEHPFKYLKIEGGNITHIAFEQNKNASVRVFKNWYGYENKVVKAYVKNDTLFVKFPNKTKDYYEKQFLQRNTMVRIFAPELLYVDGFDTNIGLFKLEQKSVRVNLSGKSTFEVESYLANMDSLHITQSDSSEVVFEMSPDLKGKLPIGRQDINANVPALRSEQAGLQDTSSHDVVSHSWQTMYVKSVSATVKGSSLLDLGQAQINSLQLNISDTSAIILSGESLRKFKR